MAEMSNDVRREFAQLVDPTDGCYVPNDIVTSHTRHVDLTTVAGPAGVGKNTVMTKTGLSVVVSDTTRQPRENDGVLEVDEREYFFRDDIAGVYEDLVYGMYVQVALVDMGEKGANIYGSRNVAYPANGPALIDVIAGAIPKIRALRPNFNSIESAYIVAPDYETWIARLDGRGTIPPLERTKRMEEAFQSLQLGLDDHEMTFVLNEDPTIAAEALRQFAKERYVARDMQVFAKNCGYKILCSLSHELNRPL